MDTDTNSEVKRYYEFKDERRGIFSDIEVFLTMAFRCFLHIENRHDYTHVVNSSKESVKLLIKSLCQIHALYGFPTKEGNTIDKFAVKKVLLNDIKKTEKMNEQNVTVMFVDYLHKEIVNDEFWESIFRDVDTGLFSPESGLRLREPAYYFLQMVRDIGSIDRNKYVSVIGREWLESLPDDNTFKPHVWAQDKVEKSRYGVSLGVGAFVRPLYLFTKLSQLNQSSNVENSKLENVKAIQIRKIRKRKHFLRDPCVNCQRSFGFLSGAPLGNCAEYDVVGIVKPDLFEKDQWHRFKSACGQHFLAFKRMLDMVEINYSSFEEIIESYFRNTRGPLKPTVLKYEWNSEKSVFDLVFTPDWPLPQ